LNCSRQGPSCYLRCIKAHAAVLKTSPGLISNSDVHSSLPSINLRPICQHPFTYSNRSLTPTFKQLQTLLSTKEVCHVLEDIGFAGFIKRDEEPDAGLTASWSLEWVYTTSAFEERGPGWGCFYVGMNTKKSLTVTTTQQHHPPSWTKPAPLLHPGLRHPGMLYVHHHLSVLITPTDSIERTTPSHTPMLKFSGRFNTRSHHIPMHQHPRLPPLFKLVGWVGKIKTHTRLQT
jgi:hypothetical protein